MHELYICKYQNIDFLTISTPENILIRINESKFENWNDHEKFLRRNDSREYHEYKAKLFCKTLVGSDKNINFLVVQDYRDKSVCIELYNSLQHFRINEISFSESLLDIEFPINVFDVKHFYCNGKLTKGIIDLEKYHQIETIHILNYNKNIQFRNCSNTIHHVTIWYFNPKIKSIIDIIDFFPNVQEILIHHTNIENLNGIERLKKLRHLHIDYGRNLKSVRNLNLSPNLKEVTFNNCRKIEDLEMLRNDSSWIITNVRLPG